MTFQNLEAMNSTHGYSGPMTASMSDVEEALRYAQAHEESFGVGEELYDPDGARANAKLFGARSDSP
jgi:hypothetical protein